MGLLKALVVGGLAAGGAAVVYAIATTETAQRVVAAEGRMARGVVRKAAQMITGISQKQLDKIAKYNLAALVEQYRGTVPFGAAMAIFEHESGFEALLYNYYVKDRQGNPVLDAKGRKILKQAMATPGAAPVARWTLANQDHPELNGGFAFDPHAVGEGQILDDLRIKGGFKFGGVALPYLTDLVDPEKNVHASLANLNAEIAKYGIAAKAGGDPWLLNALTYWIHANGVATLVGGRGKPGAFSKITGAVTWGALAALPWGQAGWWVLSNSIAGIAAAADRAKVWEAAKASLLGQAAPVNAAAGSFVAAPVDPSAPGVPPVVPVECEPAPDDATVGRADRGAPVPGRDRQPDIDALLAQIEQAEMARDLATAADLRAQLAALTGDGGDGGNAA